MGPRQDIWLETGDPSWLALSAPRGGRADGQFGAQDKQREPWPAGAEQVDDGIVQRFEGGTLLRLERPASPTTLVLVGADSGLWRAE